MALSAEFIEELKKRNSIVDVINSYIKLDRAGTLYKACCPFHNEKTPSFTVYERTGSFYCFGCGAGGDVITFVMRADNVDRYTAIETLAKRAGLAVPTDGYNKAAADKRRTVIEINREAARYYHTQLISGRYPDAVQYVKERGLEKAVNRFGIGYCPPEGKATFRYLTDLGFKQSDIQTSFICNRGNYDIFSGRLIFPLIDTAGNVVAFSARSLLKKPPDGRKYINTNDTPAFNKRKNLFALNFAKNSNTDHFILCEGQTDVISLHMAGFSTAVASLGTAFTPEQASLLAKYKSKVIICYDGDDAGKRATQKAINYAERAGLETMVLSLPEGLDPDEFIKKYGKERFSIYLKESIGQMDYRCGQVLAAYDLTRSDQKVQASERVADVIASVYSVVEREIYSDKYADRLGISKESFRTVVEQKHRRISANEKKQLERELIRQTEGYGDRINPDKLKMTLAAYAEEAIIGIAQINPDYIMKAENEGILSVDDMKTQFNKRVYSAMRDCIEKENRYDLALISENFTQEEVGAIVKMEISRRQLSDNSYKVFADYASALRSQKDAEDSGSSSIDYINDLINKKSKKGTE